MHLWDPAPPRACLCSAAHTSATAMRIHKPNHAHTSLNTHIIAFAFALACISSMYDVLFRIRFCMGMHISSMYDVLCVTYQLNRDSTQVSVYNQSTWSILAPPNSPLLNTALITTVVSTARLCAARPTRLGTSRHLESTAASCTRPTPCFYRSGWTWSVRHHDRMGWRSRNQRGSQCLHSYIYIHNTHIYIYTYVYAYINTYIYIYNTHTHIYIYVYAYIIYIYIHVYIYMI